MAKRRLTDERDQAAYRKVNDREEERTEMPDSARNRHSKISAHRRSEEIQEQIRQRAYELYAQRGRQDGHDLDDWLTAESEVTRKIRTVAA